MASQQPTFKPTTNPPPTKYTLLSYPAPHVLLVTLNREKNMNAIPFPQHWELHTVFQWLDAEPSLRVAVLTGKGNKAFCAGQDLIELGKFNTMTAADMPHPGTMQHAPSGFGGVSRRLGRKPVIAAVNGLALGGGFEIVLGCDMVVASPTARFGFPEILRGLYASAGGIPRAVRNLGMPLATELLLTARQLSAQEAKEYRLVNRISKSQASVVDEAVELAKIVASMSPDGVVVTRAALRDAWEHGSVERSTQLVDQRFQVALRDSDNYKEGLKAFAEKRPPVWVPSKL